MHDVSEVWGTLVGGAESRTVARKFTGQPLALRPRLPSTLLYEAYLVWSQSGVHHAVTS